MSGTTEELYRLICRQGCGTVEDRWLLAHAIAEQFDVRPRPATDPVMVGAWLSTSYECRDTMEARGRMFLDYLKGSGLVIVPRENVREINANS